MKKFLAILAIAGTLVACNNDSETTDTTDTTTTINTDVNAAPMTTDTTGMMMDTTGMNTTDTTAAGTTGGM